jgi:hypothetical protein
MRAISGKTVHGNPSVNENERREAMKIRDQVLALWTSLYDRQKEQVLKWPASLGDEFVESVEDRKFGEPIASGQLLVDLLERYRNYAKGQFPTLIDIVKAKKIADATSAYGGAYGRDGGQASYAAPALDANGNPIEEDYIVEWADQGALRAQLEFPQRPSSLQVWITQEDLWVYETLLNAIKKTNEAAGASRPDNAAIRVIQALEVGQKAAPFAREPGAIMIPATPGAEGAPYERGGVVGPPAAESMYGTEVAGPVDAGQAMLVNRYIGPEGEPIADATGDFSGEFRRLPVRMILMMDPQALPTVLIECANAALPVEVKRIRINKEKSGAGFDSTMAAASAGGGGGGDSGGYGPPGGYGREGGGYGREGGPVGRPGYGREGGSAYMPSTPIDVIASPGLATVEIHGIVYIYNPPDPTTLSVPGAEEAVASADAAGDTAPL